MGNEKLIGIQPLVDIAGLILQSAYLTNPYHPLSLLYIAPPEHAKTSAIMQFKQLKNVYYVNDISWKKIVDDVLPYARRKEIRHILIPDLLNCVEKQKSTRQQFLNGVKSLIEEGITKTNTYTTQFNLNEKEEPVKCGIITAITSTDFRKARKYIQSIGLLSRFVPFSYKYPLSKIREIFEVIEGYENKSKLEIPKINTTEKTIPDNPELFKKFEPISFQLGKEYEGSGSRIQTNLQILAKSSALMHNRKNVINEDVEKILKLSDYINYGMNDLV